MTQDQIIEERVRDFARHEASAVFEVWDAAGDFMARRAEARAATDAYAAEQAGNAGASRVTALQTIGYFVYVDHYSALIAQWDAALALEAAAEERQPGRRRPRQHHIRSVYR